VTRAATEDAVTICLTTQGGGGREGGGGGGGLWDLLFVRSVRCRVCEATLCFGGPACFVVDSYLSSPFPFFLPSCFPSFRSGGHWEGEGARGLM